ncbi:MAG TPA: hypothetical protein VFQ32_01645 [Ktedonobacterales bacterium]|nr:hypothetical protein [Ktedonobacterales bacterium]
MEPQRIKLVAKAHEGHITIHAEIAVSGDADTCVVKIDVEPQPKTPPRTLDELYGLLADTPLPEPHDAQ